MERLKPKTGRDRVQGRTALRIGTVGGTNLTRLYLQETSALQGVTHVGQAHFFFIVHTGNIGFTLGNKVVFLDVACEKQFLCSFQVTQTQPGAS